MQVLPCKAHTVIIYVFRQSPFFMMFNMKSIAIAFPQHTNYGGIYFINVFYQVTDEGRAITSHLLAVPIYLNALEICMI